MNFQGAIGFMVVGITLLAALFLVIFGAMEEQPTFITVGVGILSTAFGAVMRQFFPDIVEVIKRKK